MSHKTPVGSKSKLIYSVWLLFALNNHSYIVSVLHECYILFIITIYFKKRLVLKGQ